MRYFNDSHINCINLVGDKLLINIILALIGCAHLYAKDVKPVMEISPCITPILQEMRYDFECVSVARDDLSENTIAVWCIEPHKKRRIANDTIYVISTIYIYQLYMIS